jgi:hypothetical protein
MQVAELKQRDRAVRPLDAILELLDGQTPVEVMRAQQVDDRRAVAVAGAQRRRSADSSRIRLGRHTVRACLR